ncbi:hypothetical protein D3C71_1779170 [compost metagenome]
MKKFMPSLQHRTCLSWSRPAAAPPAADLTLRPKPKEQLQAAKVYFSLDKAMLQCGNKVLALIYQPGSEASVS